MLESNLNRRAESKSKASSGSEQRLAEDDGCKEDGLHFDETAIFDRYHRLHHDQYCQLKTANLSERLKQKLWGFSEGSVLSNHCNPEDLVVHIHPLKGRIIMTKDKYKVHQRFKQRETNIKQYSAFDSNGQPSSHSNPSNPTTQTKIKQTFRHQEEEVIIEQEEQAYRSMGSNARLNPDPTM